MAPTPLIKRLVQLSSLVLLFLGSGGSVSQAFFTGSQWATAGNLTKIYDPSVGETGPWFFNDHTFIKDASGTWHLIGITDEEPLIPPGVVEDSDQFGHATAPSLAGPWTKRPFVLTTYNQGSSCTATTCYHETHLWAPHIIFSSGVYYMFYSGGGTDRKNEEINLATSTDLYNWTRSSGGPLFKDGYEARDPMVIRYNNQWIMYYTATEFPQQQSSKHIVAYRTSTDLVHWGARQIAFKDLDEGTDAGGTESPFVVQRGTWFYLFLGPRPYDAPYIPPDYPGTDVFASTNPLSFDIAQHVGHIANHAAEVIPDGTNLFVSHAGWATGGVYTAPLTFNDTPVSGTNLYALSASKDSIWKWSGSGSTWNQIGGPASKLVAAGFGTFAVQPSGINRYSGSGTSWTNVGGAAASFAVNAIGLYRINTGGGGMSKWSGTGTTWNPIGGPASAIYAGGRDVFGTDPSLGNIYRYNGNVTQWDLIGDAGTTWAVNANGIYGLNDYGVFQWSGLGTYWVWIDVPANALYAGGNSVYDTTPFFNDLYQYTNATDHWTPVSGASSATSIAVCDNALYSLRSTGVYKQNGSSWTQIRNVAMSSIVCGK
jgi:hypothetical protein